MPHLKVIRASAGSGKTYFLTGEYLKLLFADSDYFMHILAVTFTNKATGEMKERIVRELHLLSTGMYSKHLEDLIQATGFAESIVRSKANIILKKILHNYSRFSINTIDSYFQTVIRSFTRELGIQGGYNIELDTEMVLNALIDRLYIQVENDNSLLEWLVRFAESQIEQGKSWNFRKNISRLGSEIFKESFKLIHEKTINKFSDRKFLEKFQEELYSISEKIEKEYRLFGEKAVGIIRSNGLSTDDFSGKARGPAGFMSQLAAGVFKEATATAKEAADNPERWFTKSSPNRYKIEQLCKSDLMSLMQQAIHYYNSNSLRYHSCAVIIRNLYVLGILSDLSVLATAYCEENNIFLLPEASVFLNKIIADNDTPFVYEKTGTWYHHFMIDEFQDTSLFQWNNFKPLISNSLSQNYDDLVVGDAKQSIYRWRNSNWEILSGGIERDFAANSIEIFNLSKNWRSGKKIIDFNNIFFRDVSFMLQQVYDEACGKFRPPDKNMNGTSIKDIYADVAQSYAKPDFEDGIVQIEQIKDENDQSYEDKINQKLIELICDLQDEGYALSDIAIIARKNKEAKLLADFLLDYGNLHPQSSYRFDVISDEALRMASSPLLNFLAGLLRYLLEPDNTLNNYYLYSEFINYIDPSQQEYRIPFFDSSNYLKDNKISMPPVFSDLLKLAGRVSLYETIEYLINRFKLNRFKGELVYLQSFQDMAMEFSRKNSPDVARFLEYWENTGREKSVTTPAGQDAIRLLTIHKAKGLEFKIVIIPYCNWELNAYRDTILWCKPDEMPFSQLEAIPLNYSVTLGKTIFAKAYFNELRQQYIDSLNLLYVAFTRAQSGLYVFCPGPGEQVKTVADLIGMVTVQSDKFEPDNTDTIRLSDYYNKNDSVLKIGNLPAGKRSKKIPGADNLVLADIPVSVVAEKIKIAFQGNLYFDAEEKELKRPVSEGKIMHEIFRYIRTKEDILPAVEHVFLEGRINTEEKSVLKKRLQFLMNDIQILSWFSGEWKVLTEAEIILPQKGTRRPDRVMVKDENAMVVDFKFGEKISKSHDAQVKEYAGLLNLMGYKQVEAYLWYVNIGRVIKVGS